MQIDAQNIGKLSRYFKEGMCDFGPHQTIPVLTYLSPFPPSIQVIRLLPEQPFEQFTWKMDVIGSFSCGASDKGCIHITHSPLIFFR